MAVAFVIWQDECCTCTSAAAQNALKGEISNTETFCVSDRPIATLCEFSRVYFESAPPGFPVCAALIPGIP